MPAASLRGFARHRGTTVKDPQSGDGPGGGASQGGAAAFAGASPPSAPTGGRKDGAGPGNGSASASAAQHKNKSRKRRKRRGRKVYSREPAAAAAIAVPAPVAPQPNAAQLAPHRQAAPAQLTPMQATLAQADPVQRPPSPTRPAHQGDLPVFAALDLGTNNCRLLVAVPGRPGQFRVIDAFSRIVRLGEGLSASGRLGEAAMDRAVEALKVCADKLGNRAVRRARLIATEACRAAENGAEFLGRVEAETGLVLEIIDRETEARLAVSGCGSLVERDTDGVVLFDIGGGSSEIALIDLSRQRTPRLASHIVSWTSLPVGVVSLAERFGGRDVTRESFRAMVDDVAAHLLRFEGRGRLDHMVAGSRFHLLGTSGTVTTLAGVHLGLERYDRRRVDGLWMDRGSVDGMVERLLGWDFHARVANPCIGADRADLVLAGCAILEAIREVWPSERLRVADRGLREGILSELMAEEGVWRRDRGDGWRR